MNLLRSIVVIENLLFVEPGELRQRAPNVRECVSRTATHSCAPVPSRAAVIAVVFGQYGTARADIVDEWSTITPAAAPQLKPAALDAKTTALLMLDFLPPNCGKSPRCVDVAGESEADARRRPRRATRWSSIRNFRR